MHPDIHKPSIDKKTEAQQTKTAKFALHNQSKKKISYCKRFIYILFYISYTDVFTFCNYFRLLQE